MAKTTRNATTVSQQGSFVDVEIDTVLSPEGVDDLIKELATFEKTGEAAKEHAAAGKAIRSAIPNQETPTRFRVTNATGEVLGVIEETIHSRTPYDVKGGTTHTKRIKFPE